MIMTIRPSAVVKMLGSCIDLKRPRLREVDKNVSYSVSRLRATTSTVAMVAAAEGFRVAIEPFAASVRDFNVPDFILKYFHGINMAIVLFAMGFYGCGYLGWTIRNSKESSVTIKARELHPPLAIGMTIFFALGAVGGITSLAVQDKPIFESPHVWTAITGLICLLLQGMLTLFFQDDPSLRKAHAYFGSTVLVLFTMHMGLGLKLALSL